MSGLRKLQGKTSPAPSPAGLATVGACSVATLTCVWCAWLVGRVLASTAEIDRTIKKVQEGVIVFDDIWERVRVARRGTSRTEIARFGVWQLAGRLVKLVIIQRCGHGCGFDVYVGRCTLRRRRTRRRSMNPTSRKRSRNCSVSVIPSRHGQATMTSRTSGNS